MLKNELGERVFNTYKGWKLAIIKLCKTAIFEGNKDIANAKTEEKHLGHWDGEKGVIYL